MKFGGSFEEFDLVDAGIFVLIGLLDGLYSTVVADVNMLLLCNDALLPLAHLHNDI